METPAPLTPQTSLPLLLSQDLYSVGEILPLSEEEDSLDDNPTSCCPVVATVASAPFRTLMNSSNGFHTIRSQRYGTSTMPTVIPSDPTVSPLTSSLQPHPYSQKKKRERKFRLNGKNCFLTFPRCQMTKEQILTNLLAFPKPIEWAMIVQEPHQDGAPHIHIALSFVKRVDITSPSELDLIGGKHGNYQTTRNVQAVIQYISKHDKVPLTHGVLPSSSKPRAQQENKGDQVTQMLIDGKTRKEVMEAFPGYYLLNRMKIIALEAEIPILTKKTIQMTHQIVMNCGETVNEEETVIYNWLAANLFNENRPLKTQQLYIWGAPNSNKTSLYHSKLDFLRVYHMPNSELFDCLYSDDGYDLVVYDEFTKSRVRSGAFINQFSDGQHVTLRTKGGQVLKKKNLPMLILSNFPPADCLDCSELPSFLARFTVVELKAPLNLDNLVITKTPLADTEPTFDPDTLLA